MTATIGFDYTKARKERLYLSPHCLRPDMDPGLFADWGDE